MTNRYVIDAYAWVEYLAGTERGKKVRDILTSERDVYTSVLTLAEITSKVKRNGNDPETAFVAIAAHSSFVEIDCQLARNAGEVHFEGRKTMHDFGLADAFVLATARRLGAKILTGDEHFRDFEESIMIK